MINIKDTCYFNLKCHCGGDLERLFKYKGLDKISDLLRIGLPSNQISKFMYYRCDKCKLGIYTRPNKTLIIEKEHDK